MLPSRLRALTTTAIIGLLVIGAVIVGVGGFVLRMGENGDGSEAADRFTVRRGSFDITIPSTGELAAEKQITITNELEMRAVITEIVDEGVMVSKGDVLLRLNDEEIRERIKDAEDDVNTAEAAWVAAVSSLDIRRQSNASEMAQANVNVQLAELALKAWEEGEDLSERQKLRLDVETAQKDYDRLVIRFEASQRLLEQEFISQDEYRRDEIEMIRARSQLDQAKLAEKVYQDYLAKQQRAKLESDLQQAKDKRHELEQRHETELNSLRTDVDSRKYQLDSRKERLAKLQRQLLMCTVQAPQAGLVVYASSLESSGWRHDDDPPQVGTELHRNQPVIVLPDTSQMVAEVKVNEALSGKIHKGQLAILNSDVMPDRTFEGEVIDVGVLAETGGWRDPNRRDYTVRIRMLEGNDLGLKPSMRCRADLYVGQVADAIHIPVQAVLREGATTYVYVPDGNGFAQRQVTVGQSSELFIEVTSGLEEGEVVYLRTPTPDQITKRIIKNREGDSRSGRNRTAT